MRKRRLQPRAPSGLTAPLPSRLGPNSRSFVARAGAALAVALVLHELEREVPLIPFDLLRVPLFSLSIAASVYSFTGQMAALFIAAAVMLLAALMSLSRLGVEPVSARS